MFICVFVCLLWHASVHVGLWAWTNVDNLWSGLLGFNCAITCGNSSTGDNIIIRDGSLLITLLCKQSEILLGRIYKIEYLGLNNE